eukprot:13846287-Heterocapsa_arctica.AAC.1
MHEGIIHDILNSPVARRTAAQRGARFPERALGALILADTAFEPLTFALLELGQEDSGWHLAIREADEPGLLTT